MRGTKTKTNNLNGEWQWELPSVPVFAELSTSVALELCCLYHQDGVLPRMQAQEKNTSTK